MPHQWIHFGLSSFSQSSCVILAARTNRCFSKSQIYSFIRVGSTSALPAPMSSSTHHLSETSPYTYTSGRWLHQNKEQRAARYVGFDLDQLLKRVIESCPGASGITSCHKHEGGFNKVFVFTLDNRQRVVAKLPTRIAGPPKLTTNSEVATIKYRMLICPSLLMFISSVNLLVSAIKDYCADTQNFGLERRCHKPCWERIHHHATR